MMLGAAVAAQASGTGSVEGTVTNHEGKAIEVIEVAVVNEEGNTLGHTTTASNGTYTVPGLSAGDYTVVFSDKTEKYLTKKVPVTVEEGNITKVNAVLTKAGSIVGEVMNAATNAPLSGVRVDIESVEHPEDDFRVVTEANGRYRVPNLEPGRYEITAFSAEGEYLSQSFSVSLPKAKNTPSTSI